MVVNASPMRFSDVVGVLLGHILVRGVCRLLLIRLHLITWLGAVGAPRCTPRAEGLQLVLQVNLALDV